MNYSIDEIGIDQPPGIEHPTHALSNRLPLINHDVDAFRLLISSTSRNICEMFPIRLCAEFCLLGAAKQMLV